MGVHTMVHGDDYVSAGSDQSLRWLKMQLEKKFDFKTSVLGEGPGDQREVKVLNRVLRLTEEGIEYEADPRHAELIVRGMGMTDAKGVSTAGVDEPIHGTGHEGVESEGEPLGQEEATAYRAIAARANYLAPDRPDMQYATKEICRRMCEPKQKDWMRLKRLARYLVHRPRVVAKFLWQREGSSLEVHTDSNWAGCKSTRKSTSGGLVAVGLHCIKAWSKTQATIALSSGEAELFAVVKGVCEALGVASLLRDLGVEQSIRLHTDAAAALGIIARKGVGKVRHLDTSVLWLQQKELQKAVEFLKVAGVENPSDMMTKHIAEALVVKFLAKMGMQFEKGRAAIAAKVHK
jgi:hypothetical protein